MNRALPEMLNCMNAPGSLVAAGNCTDMTVLDRQRARMKWQHDQLQQQQHQGYFGGSDLNGVFSHLPIQASEQVQSFQGLIGLGDSGMGQAAKLGHGSCGFEMNGSNNISRTFSCPPKVAAETKNNNTVVTDKISSPAGKESFKKRKADKGQNNKVCDSISLHFLDFSVPHSNFIASFLPTNLCIWCYTFEKGKFFGQLILAYANLSGFSRL